MTQQRERSFVIADPRDFDGNPFEVAARAVAQIEGLLALAEGAIPLSELMARNAEMTRRIDLGGEPEGDRWAGEPQGRQWALLREEVTAIRRRLKIIKAASAYDPKHPPR